MKTKQKGFTMIELLTVIGIVAILAVVVVLTINPQQLLMQSRDSNRVGSLTTIVTSVALAKSEGLSLGTPNVAYISIPDPTLTGNQTSTCASLGLPALASTTYQCVSPANVAKDDGTGWIPIAFTSLPGGFPLGSLPVDPVNSTSSNEYYIYTTNGTGYEVMANPEAAKNASNTSSFVQGSNLALVTSFPTGSSGGGTSGQNIWVGDMNNKRVEEFSLSGKYLSQFGTPGSGNGQFDFLIPQAFARVVAGIPILPAISSNGTIWVADMGNYRVEEFSSAGIYESQFGSNGSSNGQFGSTIQGIAIDASGNIWVTDYNNNRVEEFSSTGIYESQLGCTSGACSAGSSNGQFNYPFGIAIDASGNIWVADQINNRVQEFSATGTYESQFGSYGSSTGQFSYPANIAIDASGNIWVVDEGNNRVEEFSSTGTYKSQLGCTSGACSSGSSNGQFYYPSGIAIDASGNIWVGDTLNNRVEEFSSTGIYESQLGCTSGACSAGSSNGQFNSPWGITIH